MAISSATSALVQPLIFERKSTALSDSPALSENDKKLLAVRGLNTQQQQKVASIYSDARHAVQAGQGKNYLANLDAKSLQLLQGAAGLAEPIDAAAVSEEGAENLLLAPSRAVDRDGDGLIQTGIAHTLQFPPPDASPQLREAWEKTTASLDEGDALTLRLVVGGALLGGKAVAVGNAPVEGSKLSADFDWGSYISDRIYTNNLARPYNSAEAYQKIDSQLKNFLAALKEQGLA